MRLISFEAKNEKLEKELIDKIEEYIAKIDKKGQVDVNYFVIE